jgi:hypothetical protein
MDGVVKSGMSMQTLRLMAVTPGPIWMAHEWAMSVGARV